MSITNKPSVEELLAATQLLGKVHDIIIGNELLPEETMDRLQDLERKLAIESLNLVEQRLMTFAGYPASKHEPSPAANHSP